MMLGGDHRKEGLRALMAVAFAFLSLNLALAQTTKVRGQVVDASDGSPIPFTAVFFEGSQVGTSTDAKGNFTISTRDLALTRLTASMLGYNSETVTIRAGVFSNTLFFLKPNHKNLGEVTVKADDKLARRLLAGIDAHRQTNNPECRPGYSCDVYSKLELDLSHPRERLKGKNLKKQWSFIFDYVDTSDVSGVPYLPIMINESVIKRYHGTDPDVDREEVIANRLSGAAPEGSLLTQFTGSLHLRNNFYSPFIDAFNVNIPSPINSGGMLYYNYYIIDTLQIDSRKTYYVRYHPRKSISTPAFDGEMLIDAQEFAIRRIKARLIKGQNINWVKDMLLEAEYVRRPDSIWFYKTDRCYADFAVANSDSSKLISLIGNRTLEFTNPVFEKQKVDASKTVTTVAKDAGEHSEEYWQQTRPYDLTRKEKDIYNMVDSIQNTRLYRTLYDITYSIINGYWERGQVGVGQYLKFISYNPLEGLRLRAGMRTTTQWSKTDRISAYFAYGFDDHSPKGGLTWEHLFSKEPTRKLTVDAHYDVLQLGRGTNRFNTDNILASVLGAGKTQKLLPVAEGSILYEHEFTNNFNTGWQMMYRNYYSNNFVPMITSDGALVHNISNSSAGISLRWSRDETVNRGNFKKLYVHTKYPIFTLQLAGGAGRLGMEEGQVTTVSTAPFWYFQPELSIDWTCRIKPIGISQIHINTGTIVGKVPYPMLHIHEGNGTMLLDKTSFSCMNFFEFASDSWVTLMLDHNFYGFFLGKIPWVKKLQLREAFTFKMAWGALSDKNNGAGGSAMLRFPGYGTMDGGMHSMGSVPYIETGFAITNIFRLLRIDFIWRCTHRDDVRENPRNFAVNLGVEFRF